MAFSKCGRASGCLIHPPGGTSQSEQGPEGESAQSDGEERAGVTQARLVGGTPPPWGTMASAPVASTGGVGWSAPVRGWDRLLQMHERCFPASPFASADPTSRCCHWWESPSVSRAEAAHGPRRWLFRERRCLFPPLPRKRCHFHRQHRSLRFPNSTPVTWETQLCPWEKFERESTCSNVFLVHKPSGCSFLRFFWGCKEKAPSESGLLSWDVPLGSTLTGTCVLLGAPRGLLLECWGPAVK